MWLLNKNESGQNAAKTRTIDVDWQICDDDSKWRFAEEAMLLAPVPARHRRLPWWVAVTVVSLLLVTGGWLWYQAHVGLTQIEAELRTAVEVDQWRAQRYDATQAKQLSGIQDNATQEIARSQLASQVADFQLIALESEWAVLRVTTEQGGQSYNQTRLYHWGANGWYRATPTAAFWGTPHTLETDYFVFHYFALDAVAVASAGAKLDKLYPRLTTSFHLEVARNNKRVVWVTSEHPLLGNGYGTSGEGALVVGSPAITLVPSNIDQGDFLAQSVLLSLLNLMAEESLQHQVPSGWQDPQAMSQVRELLQSLQLWLIWSTNLPLAALHKPTVQWLYSDVQPKSRMLPALRKELCPFHSLWLEAPYVIQLPLFCGDPAQMEGYHVGFYLLASPRTLAGIPLFAPATAVEPFGGLDLADMVGLATIIDYAATTYGNESITRMVANAANASSWEIFISTTFGVPLSEFEAGWNAHLRDHYQTPPRSFPESL